MVYAPNTNDDSLCGQAFFGKETVEEISEDRLASVGLTTLSQTIGRLVDEGEIGRAEDLLFDSFGSDRGFLLLAIDFYQKLNALSDAELEDADFPREEVASGLGDILGRFGMPKLI